MSEEARAAETAIASARPGWCHGCGARLPELDLADVPVGELAEALRPVLLVHGSCRRRWYCLRPRAEDGAHGLRAWLESYDEDGLAHRTPRCVSAKAWPELPEALAWPRVATWVARLALADASGNLELGVRFARRFCREELVGASSEAERWLSGALLNEWLVRALMGEEWAKR